MAGTTFGCLGFSDPITRLMCAPSSDSSRSMDARSSGSNSGRRLRRDDDSGGGGGDYTRFYRLLGM